METVLEVNNTREVIYPQVETRVFEDIEGGELFSDELAKHLLGWTEPAEGKSFDIYNFVDINKQTIFCANVDLQRPYYQQTCIDLMWDILGGNWEFNLETVIIGKTGLVLDGKHRLIALIFACQEYARNPERYPYWEEPPQLEILIALGADETKRLVNTIGTGRPRTLADSFYASGLFSKEDTKQMKRLCRMAEHTIRLLWVRTNAKTDSYNTRFSHSDALSFIENHPNVISCIKTIHEENDGKNRRLEDISGAYAPGLLYLMVVSNTNPEQYRLVDCPSESQLDFSAEELAEKYWYLLATKDPSVSVVTTTITEMSEMGNRKADERAAIIVKGWNAYVEKGWVEYSDINLEIKIDDHGHRVLLEDPVVSGIDVGFHPHET